MPPKKKKFNNTRNKKTFDIVYADQNIGQEYGYVEKLFGNCHFKVMSIQNEERVASLTGIMKKKCRVREQDLVLMEPLTDSDNGKYLIIFRYTQDQKKILEKEGKLKKVETEQEETNTTGFMFEGEEETNKNETLDVDEWFIDDI